MGKKGTDLFLLGLPKPHFLCDLRPLSGKNKSVPFFHIGK